MCAGAETKAFHVWRPFLASNSRLWRVLGVQLRIMTFFWRLTPDSSMNLAFNAKLRRHSSNKVWTIIYCWKALDVYFPTPSRARHLKFYSSRKSTWSAWRSESNSISSPFSTSESDFCSSPSISVRKYLKSQKNTQTHSKVQKYEFNIKTNENIPKSN